MVFPPLDQQLKVMDGGWSEMVAKLAVWLCGQVEDDLAEQILQRLSDIEMSDTSIWRRKEVWGEKMRAQEAEETLAARAWPHHGAGVRGQKRSRPRMGAARDGSMAHVRGERWNATGIGFRDRPSYAALRSQETKCALSMKNAASQSFWISPWL